MTTRSTIVAALLAVLAALAVVPAGAAATQVRFTGTVTDSAGYPLAGVRVEVVRADLEDAPDREATTDAQGAFTTPAVPVDAGTSYVLRASDPTGRHLETTTKEFPATTANARQDVTMAAAAVVRGTVSEQDGDTRRPATDVLVTALRVGSDGLVDVGGVFTSSRGTFVLGGLPSGSYTLMFEDVDEDGTRPGPRFRPTCYDDVPKGDGTCADGTRITLEAGRVTTIEPQLMADRIGRLSGTVTDSAGRGLAGRTVSIRDAGRRATVLAEARTSSTGAWSASVDHVGDVKIVATDATGKHRTTWYTRAATFETGRAVPHDGSADVGGLRLTMPLR